MGIPTLKLLFDRQKRASRTKEGAIELRITFNRVQKHGLEFRRMLRRPPKSV